MSQRPNDEVTIEADAGADFDFVCDRVTTFEITNDLLQPAQCLLEIGDDGTWNATADAMRVGRRFVVRVNGKPRLKGRMLAMRMPLTAEAGATVQMTIRTLMADAAYASCSPSINVRKGTLKDAVLAAYEPLGVTEAGFIFDADIAVDIMTGKGASSRKIVLDEIKEDQAKVSPPESIYAFVERHLNRFHLSHWDSCDGRIVIGAPNDTQNPIYWFRAKQGAAESVANNVLSVTRTIDFEQVPSHLGVFGIGGGKEYAKAKVRTVLTDPTLLAASPRVYRPVLLIDESVKTQDQAESRAMREMSVRARQSDAWTVEVDGCSYWDGTDLVPWGIDTVADMHCDLASGPASGPYLISKVTLKGDAETGYTTTLDMVARGLWRL